MDEIIGLGSPTRPLSVQPLPSNLPPRSPAPLPPLALHDRFHDWLLTPPGAYLLDWERREFERSVEDMFGYHALQLGLPELQSLQANRMSHRWLALDDIAEIHKPDALKHATLLSDFAALPFSESSLDLVTMPHTLELSGDPHDTLSEVHRVLVPDGRVVICGLNPKSLWGLSQGRAQFYQRFGWGTPYIPDVHEWIGYRRLRDWLRLLSFEVESVRFGCYRPAVSSSPWLDRTAWMDAIGARWWPILGGVYFVVAVKRVRGMTLMGQSWRRVPKLTAAPVSIASSVSAISTDGQFNENKSIEPY